MTSRRSWYLVALTTAVICVLSDANQSIYASKPSPRRSYTDDDGNVYPDVSDADFVDWDMADDISSNPFAESESSHGTANVPITTLTANRATAAASTTREPVVIADLASATSPQSIVSRTQLPGRPHLPQLQFQSSPVAQDTSTFLEPSSNPCPAQGATKNVLGQCECPSGTEVVRLGENDVCRAISCKVEGQVVMFGVCACPAGLSEYEGRCVADCRANERRHTDGSCSPICYQNEMLSSSNQCECTGRFSRLTPGTACACDDSKGLSLAEGGKICQCTSTEKVYDAIAGTCVCDSSRYESDIHGKCHEKRRPAL
jgi:hypothetical protein